MNVEAETITHENSVRRSHQDASPRGDRGQLVPTKHAAPLTCLPSYSQRAAESSAFSTLRRLESAVQPYDSAPATCYFPVRPLCPARINLFTSCSPIPTRRRSGGAPVHAGTCLASPHRPADGDLAELRVAALQTQHAPILLRLAVGANQT